MAFLRSKHVRILTVFLIAQGLGLVAISRREIVPLARPLSDLPRQFGRWQMRQEGVIEKDILEVLRADDVVTRVYEDPSSRADAGLFVAYFRSQRAGQAPHSPKNCLPGSGWIPQESGEVSIAVPGRAEPILVNRYIVSRGEEKSVVLYWYQSHNRVIASEYKAKIYVVADAIRYNRTDTALVRVWLPIHGDRLEDATRRAEDFVRSFFPVLSQYLPG